MRRDLSEQMIEIHIGEVGDRVVHKRVRRRNKNHLKFSTGFHYIQFLTKFLLTFSERFFFLTAKCVRVCVREFINWGRRS